jgi:hypothetical protein
MNSRLPRIRRWCTVCCILLFAPDLCAQWRTVAPGIEYRELRIDGPINTFVARADRSRKNWTIDTSIARGTLASGTETVADQAARCDGSINTRGEQYDILVAINGDYFYEKTGHSISGQITSGWFVKRYLDYSGGSGFVWTSDRRCFLGGNVKNGRAHQKVTFADGTTLPLLQLNTECEPDDLALYTPHYAPRTPAVQDGVDVLVRLVDPATLALESSAGEIIQVNRTGGSTPIPFDCVVLAGRGRNAAPLREHARVGERLTIRLDLKDYGVEGIPAAEWRRPYASLGGHFYCVVEGRVPTERWEPKAKPGAINRHPRTAVAFNDHYVCFIVVDGRSDESVGMTITELGRFCADELDADYAIAQDGGGSSTMWVDGKVMNVPSDGHERPVANCYFMATVTPPQRSRAFPPGTSVRIIEDTECRLGPGTNYAVLDTLTRGQSLRIADHPLAGIRAKGTHWWPCVLDKATIWLPENQLNRERPGTDTVPATQSQ